MNLVIDDLTIEHTQGGHTIRPINGLNLTVERGELVVILGPSGCGKTTLLSALAGLLTPSGGTITMGSTDVGSLSGRALNRYRQNQVGVVFQAFNLVGSLTTLENVALPLVAAGIRRRDALARAEALLRQLHLAERLDHRPDALSGGQQQRVAIARALVANPLLVLADEPTAHLDRVQVDGVLGLLRSLADEGRIVIATTHDERMLVVADRIVELVAADRGVSGEHKPFASDHNQNQSGQPHSGTMNPRRHHIRLALHLLTGLTVVAAGTATISPTLASAGGGVQSPSRERPGPKAGDGVAPVGALPGAPADPRLATAGIQEPGLIGYTIRAVTYGNSAMTQVDPAGISDNGRVVGSYVDDTGQHPFTWDIDKAVFNDVVTDADQTWTDVVAPNGSVGGRQAFPRGQSIDVVRTFWPTNTDGSMGSSVIVGQPAGHIGQALAMNSSGTFLQDSSYTDRLGKTTLLFGLDGTSQPSATDLNEAGVIAGASYAKGAPSQPVVWTAGVPTGLGYPTPGVDARAAVINDDGDVVVETTGSSRRVFFRPAKGAYQDLGNLSGHEQLTASDINNSDEIVGTISNPDFGTHPFLWSAGRLIDLQSLVKTGSHWVLETAVGINEQGQIVGDGAFNGFQTAFVLDPIPPVVFVPGAGASRLAKELDTTSVEQADEGDEIWLKCGAERRLLSLWPEDLASGAAPQKTAAFAPLRHTTCYGLSDTLFSELDGYGTFLDRLNEFGPLKEYKIDGHLERFTAAGCDTTQGISDQSATPNLFVFAYDWRLDNAKSAEKLADFMGCVNKFWPNRKVNVIAHSMGSLVTRRYVLTHPTAPVERVITIGAPWLGSPRLVNVLQTGDFAPPLVTGPVIKDIVGNFTAAHQLGASVLYGQLAEQPVMQEQGWNINNNATDNETYSASELQKFLDDQQNKRSAPGTNAVVFQGFANDRGGQADWSHGDTTGIDYTHIVGLQTGAGTIGTVVATNAVQCSFFGIATICTSKPVIEQRMVCGDGTVPLVSALRIGRGKDLNTPDADVLVLRSASTSDNKFVEHTGMGQSFFVLNEILARLTRHPDKDPAPASRAGLGAAGQELDSCTSPSTNALVGSPLAPDQASSNRYVHVVGGTDVVVTDETGANTALPPLGNAAIDSVSIYASNVPDASLAVMPLSLTHQYTMSFKATGQPLEIELLEGIQQAPTAANRWLDVAVPAGAAASLEMSPAGTKQLRFDSNGDGTLDTTVPATIEARGNDALDVIAPTVEITASGVGASTLYSVNASDAGTGVANVLWSSDGSKFEKFIAPMPLDPMIKTLFAIAQDRAGNRSNIVTVDVASVVRTALTTAKLSPSANAQGWNRGPVQVSLTSVAADGSNAIRSITWSADGAETIPATTAMGPNASFTVGAAGNTTLQFHAVSNAGTTEPNRTMQVRIDSTDPTGSISAPTDNAVVAALARIAGTASDAESGVADVSVELRNSSGQWWDGATWGGSESWLSTLGTENWSRTTGLPSSSELPPGAYRLRLRITDASGRVATPPATSITVSPDVARRATALYEVPGTTGNTSGIAINDRGLAAGASGAGVNTIGVAWRKGSGVALALPPGTDSSFVHAVTTDGRVVGSSSLGSSQSVAVIWSQTGDATVLPPLNGASYSDAHSSNGAATVGQSGSMPVQWSGQSVQALPVPGGATGTATDVNASGIIVGSMTTTAGTTALRWSGGQFTGLGTLGGNSSTANAINDLGVIVGSARDDRGIAQAFVFDGTAMTPLSLGLGSSTSSATDINNLGQIVGTITNPDSTTRAFMWTKANGLTDLNALLPPGTGWNLRSAKGINNLGQIVGFGTLNGVARGYLLSTLHAPISEDVTRSTATDQPVDIVLDSWDPDVVDTVSLRVIGKPQHGAVSAITGETLRYTPESGFNGVDTFTYQGSDGELVSNIATVTVKVGAPGGGPSTTTTTLPSTTLPSTTLPSTTLPSTTLPSTTLPSTTLPSTTTTRMPTTTTTRPSTTTTRVEPTTTLASTTTSRPRTTTTMPRTTTSVVHGGDDDDSRECALRGEGRVGTFRFRFDVRCEDSKVQGKLTWTSGLQAGEIPVARVSILPGGRIAEFGGTTKVGARVRVRIEDNGEGRRDKPDVFRLWMNDLEQTPTGGIVTEGDIRLR